MLTALQKASPFCAQSVNTLGALLRLLRPSRHRSSRVIERLAVFGSYLYWVFHHHDSAWECVYTIHISPGLRHLRMFWSLTTSFNEAYNLNLGSVQLFDPLKLFTFVENHQQLQVNGFFLFFSPLAIGLNYWFQFTLVATISYSSFFFLFLIWLWQAF